MQRLERLFAITESLRRAGARPISAARLADDFGVSRRTIERDLSSLRAAGVPLYAERGRSGGHVSLDEIGNVVVTFTPGEVTALLVAVTAAKRDMPYLDQAEEAVKRLLDVLAPSSRLGVENLRAQIRTQLPADEHAGVSRRVKRSVEAAVQRGVVLNIGYRDGSDRQTERPVDALGFYQGSDGWFLIGWCHLRRAGRIFRLDRITRANLTTRPVRPHDLDATLGWTPHELESP